MSWTLREIFFSKRGAVAIVVGLTVPVLVGAAALGTEITFLLYKQRQMQSAADSAALGGATALTTGYPSYNVEADAIAGTLGFVNGVASTAVTVNNPPKSGSYTSNSGAVEVIVSQPQSLVLTSILNVSTFNVSARAVALEGSSGNYCVLATDTGATTSVPISNGATVNLNQCGLAVNATGSSALSVVGGATLNAKSVSVAGQAAVNNGGSIKPSSALKINQAPVADPYANVSTPTASGCTQNNFQTSPWQASAWSLKPGTYCGGLTVDNGATAVLSPGIYYIKSGTFSIQGGTTVTGSGVTIVLTQNTSGSGYANVNIGNGSTVTLSAPTSGATAGILFFGDRNAPHTNVNSFVGGTTEAFTGAVYLPTEQIVYSNGSTTSSPCTQVIGWDITFEGGTSFNDNCTGTGVSSIGAVATKLVE